MSIIIAIIIFSILILIHEFGHFLLAKKNGICVTEFSLGLGPRVFSFVKGETRYSLKAIPFGGSCAMLGEAMGEDDAPEGVDMEKSFEKKGVWQRISVVAAGPIFNFLLAFVLAIIVISMTGVDKPNVLELQTDSAAYEAGIRQGDVITSYNGTGVSFSREIWLQDYVKPVNNSIVPVTINRNGEKLTFQVKPKENKRYMIGVSYKTDDNEAKVTVVKDGAFAKAGFKDNDIIVKINDTEIKTGNDFKNCMDNLKIDKASINVSVNRDGSIITNEVFPREVVSYNTGLIYNEYRDKTSSLESIKYSFVEIKYQIKTVFKSLGMLVSGKLTKDDVAGPVGVVNVISDTVNETKSEGVLITFLTLLNMTIMLSANLGVMNLLPLPALDGGRLVFLLIELVRGKPVPKEKEGIVHFAGMILLMALMVFILFNDISRLFR